MVRPVYHPSWASDLIVRRGDTEDVLLIDGSESDSLPDMIRLAWAATARGESPCRPHVVLALNRDAYDGVLNYFRAVPGEDREHDHSVARARLLVPVGRGRMIAVSPATDEQASEVEVSGDPPVYEDPGGLRLLKWWVWLLRYEGFACPNPSLDEDCLHASVQYATGDTGREQVLGWDDIYPEDMYAFLAEEGRVFISIRNTSSRLTNERIELLAKALVRGLQGPPT